MKYTILVLITILAAFSSAANASSVGLICTNESEKVPRLFKVNLSQRESSFFSYAESNWKSITTTSVSIDEIKLSKVFASLKISRITLDWNGDADIDFERSKKLSKGSCATKIYLEMNDIAKRELDKLNNKRAF